MDEHYKKLIIEPLELIEVLRFPFSLGNVVKYLSRWRYKGGVEDLRKAVSYIDYMIENNIFSQCQEYTAKEQELLHCFLHQPNLNHFERKVIELVVKAQSSPSLLKARSIIMHQPAFQREQREGKRGGKIVGGVCEEISPPTLLSVGEVGAIFGVSTGTVYNWNSSGKLKGFKIGREVFFQPYEIRHLIFTHNPGNTLPSMALATLRQLTTKTK